MSIVKDNQTLLGKPTLTLGASTGLLMEGLILRIIAFARFAAD